MRNFRRATPVLLLILAAAGAAPRVFPVAAQRQVSPLTELVDFLAVTDDGTPVTGLGSSDVTFKVDGRVRPIASLQFVELARTDSLDRGTDLAPPLAAPYGSNRLQDNGRIVLITVDRESIRPGRERPAREAALRFLSHLSPADHVGLMTLPEVAVEPTTDHAQVRDALLRMTGLSPQERTPSEAACRARLVLNTLAGMLQAMVGAEGPKTVAFISTGLAPPTRDAPMTGAPGQCEIRSVYFDEVGAAASAARAHFYIIQPNDEGVDSAATAAVDRSVSRFRSADDYLNGLQHLAGVTGGQLYRLSAVDPHAVFTRVSRESSAYYVIAFEPEPGDRNGLPHRIEVKVARERVTVRAQPQFTIAKMDKGDITPQKMLREARVYHDLPLRATAYASLNPGDSRLKIVAAAEPVDGSVAFTAAAAGLYDSKGKLVAQWTADKQELAPRPMIAALAAHASAYRLRVAAIDSNGRRGTVDYHFRAELESAGPLRLSAIALGVAGPNFQPRLRFAGEPSAVGYFEIYGNPPRASELTVRMEIAPTTDAPAIITSPASLQATEDEARRLAIAPLAIASLSPGDYLVRAIVNIDGRPAGTVYRTLRKVAK
jgi:VWFA-related protein